MVSNLNLNVKYLKLSKSCLTCIFRLSEEQKEQWKRFIDETEGNFIQIRVEKTRYFDYLTTREDYYK